MASEESAGEKLDKAVMKMLRWMCRVTKMNKTKNERIRTTKLVDISKKEQERRLQWHGHMIGRGEA